MTNKFSLQAKLLTEGVLILTDESGTEVDADIFDELITSGVRNFKIGNRQDTVKGKIFKYVFGRSDSVLVMVIKGNGHGCMRQELFSDILVAWHLYQSRSS